MALLWTEPSDVTGRWVGEEPLRVTDEQIEVLLDDAEDTMLSEFPDLVDRITRPENPLPLRRVKKVAARIVIRHLRNPSGIRSTQEGAGPFQQTRTYGGDEPGALYLTEEDRRELGGRPTGGAFTIDTTPQDVPAAPLPWAAT